ncbi:MAG TPA: RluA family pseudouridine synthase [Candidatus Saccharimonadales bacterium]|nr:RluA family pseudouridine synthase [Candidatus Saccharimonadales bacterium]
MKEFSVVPEEAGQRLDVYVAQNYPQFSRSALTGLLKQGQVTVNGAAEKAGYKLRPGDSILVNQALLSAEPAEIELPVIYQDDDVVVINKPAGILTHSKGAINSEPTVASFIKNKITDDKLQGNRAGIVHRLDRHTSGVIITARTEEALKHLQKQFSQRRTKKSYIAAVEGVLEPAEAIIDAPIQRNPKKPRTFRVNVSGKPAITHYRTLKVFDKGSQTYTLAELKPQTGRTHQLRVHMAYIHHPVAGDAVYGHGGKDMMLHARELELTLPGGERKIFKAPPPAYLKDFAGI